MNKNENKYLRRHCVVKLSLALATDCSLEYKADVVDNDVVRCANGACQFATNTFNQMLQHIQMPVDPLPGDQPMVLLQLSYFEMQDDELCENFTFSVTESETITAGRGSEATLKAAHQALLFFCRKIVNLTDCEKE